MVEDGAIAYEMGTALSDRLVHMIVQANAEDWLTSYAVPAGIHSAVAAFLRTRPDLLETTEDSLRRGFVIACTPRSWTRVSRIMEHVGDRASRQMLATPRSERAAMYPGSLHGMTALIYGLIGNVSAENLPVAIEIINDLRGLAGASYSGLPVSKLAAFGFELLIARALDNGWQAVFATSREYAEYAAERRAAGLR